MEFLIVPFYMMGVIITIATLALDTCRDFILRQVTSTDGWLMSFLTCLFERE